VRRRLVLLLSLLGLAVSALPAGAASARPLVGIGEQQPKMFTAPAFKRLHLHDARYLTPWDTLNDPYRLALLGRWMTAARRAHVRVLVGFGHSTRSSHRLPTVGQFERQFVRFRARYPWVRNWIVWNEANNGYSLTKNKPRRVAGYFDAASRHCRRCNIVGADVVDTKNMAWWVTRFKRYAHTRPRIWGLHNYVDTNWFYTRGTQRLLALTNGQVWFTETGGVVLRRMHHGRKVTRTIRYSVQHAARATAQVFRLATLSRRITRVYLYHWQPPPPPVNWDSALRNSRGRPRPAYGVLRRWLGRRGGQR
jgi:hypothetical protein